MEPYADDLAAVMKHLDLNNMVLIVFSTGSAIHFFYGTKRVAKAALVSSVPPLMVKTPNNPGGLPIDVFDGFRAAFLADRSLRWAGDGDADSRRAGRGAGRRHTTGAGQVLLHPGWCGR